MFATEKVRTTKWYTPMAVGVTWFIGLGVTLTMTSAKDDIGFDPVILPWIVFMFCLLNCTRRWYAGTISIASQLALNSAACLYTFGSTMNVQRTTLVYFFITIFHLMFSLREEVHYREAL